jgi:effector-binding domain-containing protein
MTARTINAPATSQSSRRLTLYQHHRASEADIPAAMGRAFEALYTYIARAGVAPAGPPFAIYHNEPVPGGEFEIDICVPLSAAVPPSADIEFMELPATRVVSLLHVGPYDTLATAYGTVKAYAAEHGLTPSGAPREFYLSPPDVPPDEIQTLLELPVS